MLLPTLAPSFHMWVTFAFVAALIVFYIWERLAIEVSSALCLAVMIVVFHVVPLRGPNMQNLLDAHTLLAGFGNPALITVLSMIIIGQALVSTGALNRVAYIMYDVSGGNMTYAVAIILTGVSVMSAFLNNTPVVVIFIPVLLALSAKMDHCAAQVMMPLSFAAILGGMTTLIGSSTNLLVSRSLADLGYAPLGFFDFSPMGIILAAVGLAYILFLCPLLLPKKTSEREGLTARSGQQFLSHLTVQKNSPLIGVVPVAGHFQDLSVDVTVLVIWRQRRAVLPPFDQFPLEPGDILVIATTRKVLSDIKMHEFGVIPSDSELELELGPGGTPPSAHRQIVEAMVAPGGGLAGRTIRSKRFLQSYGCLVLGLQRRTRMIRSKMNDITLEVGDILLLYGTDEVIASLPNQRDLVVLEESAVDVPTFRRSKRALTVFVGVIMLAATDLLPIVVAALLGATLMILLGAIRLSAALRSIDFKLVFIVATSLALGTALEVTGGATFIAEQIMIGLFFGAGPAVLLSAHFLIVVIFTNLISNNACAVLFTPIGVHIALAAGIDPHIFAVTTLFAANCSFCTPIGYQTNLLVMGPGHYRFIDFLKAGVPLAVLIWVTFSLVAPLYYDL
ncbi:MAG: SLC13 family permease [Rhodospirillales bacterium]|nr:SLC13 family permease [Rhodospirillales bacterium]